MRLTASVHIHSGVLQYDARFLLFPLFAGISCLKTVRSGALTESLQVEDDGTCKGLSEEDLNASLATLERMAKQLNANITVLRKMQVINNRSANPTYATVLFGL